MHVHNQEYFPQQPEFHISHRRPNHDENQISQNERRHHSLFSPSQRVQRIRHFFVFGFNSIQKNVQLHDLFRKNNETFDDERFQHSSFCMKRSRCSNKHQISRSDCFNERVWSVIKFVKKHVHILSFSEFEINHRSLFFNEKIHE